MAAKLEVVITEHSGRMEFVVKGFGERTPREEAHMVALIGVIKSVVNDFDKRAAECDCPACKRKREREADNERQNIH